jgi:hypothetical protein
LKQELKELEDGLKDARARYRKLGLDSLESDVANARDRKGKLGDEIDALSSEVDDTRRQAGRIDSAVTTLEASYDTLHAAYEQNLQPRVWNAVFKIPGGREREVSLPVIIDEQSSGFLVTAGPPRAGIRLLDAWIEVRGDSVLLGEPQVSGENELRIDLDLGSDVLCEGRWNGLVGWVTAKVIASTSQEIDLSVAELLIRRD